MQSWLRAEDGARQGLTRLEGRPLHTLLLVGSKTQGQRLPHLTAAMPEGDLLLDLCLRREQQERGQGQLQLQRLRHPLGPRDFFVSSRKEAPLPRQQQEVQRQRQRQRLHLLQQRTLQLGRRLQQEKKASHPLHMREGRARR